MKSSELASTTPDPAAVPWCQVAGILVAAMVLGLIYNHASPLGVRATRPDTDMAAAPAPAIKRMGFVNETVSLSLESAATTSAPVIVPAAALNTPHLAWAQIQPLVTAGKVVLVDARAKATYNLGHIPGAVSLPSTSSADEVKAFARAYPSMTAFVVYCGSESCNASRQTAEALVRVGGFTSVSDMPGGYAEFLAAKTPPNP